MRKLIKAALFVAVLFPTIASRLPAADVTITSVRGNWNTATTTANPPAIIQNSVAISTVAWGAHERSSYTYTSEIPGPQTLPPFSTPLFSLGKFIHYNVSGVVPSLATVNLDIVLDISVNGTPISPKTFRFQFAHDETTNSFPCKYTATDNVPCDDKVTFVASPQPTTFNVDGVDYTLAMSFVDINGNPAAQFLTKESAINIANLRGQFTIPPGTVVPPTFTPNGGSFTNSVQVAMQTVTTGATIRYTTDGSTPTASSTLYTGPVTLTTNTLLKAFAQKSGMIDSDIASATFTRLPPPGGNALLNLSPASLSVNEGIGFATMTVVRSVDTAGTSTVQFAVSNGSAMMGQDYLSVSGILTFNPGETSKTFDIPLIDDAVVESNETVLVTLSNPTGATLGTSQGTLTIIDNDSTNPPPPPPSPFISELVPYSAPVGFGTSFTMRVLGARFDTTSAQVIWNGNTQLPVLSRTATEITVTVNPGIWNNTPGNYPVIVRNPGPMNSNTALFEVRPTNSAGAPPWVALQPSANPNPVNGGKTTQLSVLGGTHSNNGSESVLTYKWTIHGPTTVSLSSDGTNAAKNALATFSRVGTYTFQVRITDTVTKFSIDTNVLTVVVNPGVTSVVVTPKAKTLAPGEPFNFNASVLDQFGAPFSAPVTWSAAAGAIGLNSGSYIAPDEGLNITITASSGGKSDDAQVTVIIIGVAGGDFTNTKVGPVPYKSTSGDPGVTFRNLPPDTTIRIYTMTGRIVQTLNVPGAGDQLWDLKNANLDQVASGVYFYVLESNGQKKEGKLVIIQ